MYRRPSYHFVQLTTENLATLLQQSIEQKNILLNIYTSLLSEPQDEFITSMLSNLQATETKTKNRLEADYIAAYGATPNYAKGQADASFDSFLEGILLALRVNSQNIAFEREIMDQLGRERLGYDLYDYMLRVDMSQQDLLNTLYVYYLHTYQLGI